MRLEDMLAKEQDVTIVGMVENGTDAVAAIRSLAPDLVFLDVQMPGRTGVEVVRDVGVANMPLTIFVTAFDHYALNAFDVSAVDYLLKPFDDERFEEAFQRARRRLAMADAERIQSELRAVLERSAPFTGGSAAQYLDRIAVESRGKVRPIPVEEIDYITSDGPYAELHVGDRRHIIRESMQSLEERLDPARFMRVHRSVIVRLDLVDVLHRGAGGDYELQLKNGQRVRVSRARREALEKWLGVGE
jgi:two-component system LytT family response regulator